MAVGTVGIAVGKRGGVVGSIGVIIAPPPAVAVEVWPIGEGGNGVVESNDSDDGLMVAVDVVVGVSVAVGLLVGLAVGSFVGLLVGLLVGDGVSVFVAITSPVAVEGGVNDRVGEIVGVSVNTPPISVGEEDSPPTHGKSCITVARYIPTMTSSRAMRPP
jgi:hypothetical protein